MWIFDSVIKKIYNSFIIISKTHLRKLQRGRKLYQQRRSILVQQKTLSLLQDGVKEIGKLTAREMFIGGVALYWAEGFKHPDESGLGLATSDFEMAKFYIRWLHQFLNVNNENLRLRVTANISHKHRILEIKKFWSAALNISESQFTKPFFQKVVQKKHFSNEQNYHGVIRIHVSKSLDMLRKMRGWLVGVKNG